MNEFNLALEALTLTPDDVVPYGRSAAKLPLDLAGEARGKILLVTAISPTPAGEGKTTVSIGLVQALRRLGVRAVGSLRQPSMGPVFGMKGGATGGGRASLTPASLINTHFTGDIHALTSANNLIAALVDNHLHWGQEPRLDARRITWRRCLDVNDRSLRGMLVGLGGPGQGVPRETGMDITAACELMAVLALAEGPEDLRDRLRRLVVGRSVDGGLVTAGELGFAEAAEILLSHALLPNLVGAYEGAPVIVHCGPFANIAHGCCSVLATRMAAALGDVCVTEAGFGADLGAEKFCNIKCRQSGLRPDGAVLVATVRALKYHGGIRANGLQAPSPAALRTGFANLRRHAENLRGFGLPVCVLVNHFAADDAEETRLLVDLCEEMGLPAAEIDCWGRGGAGGEAAGRLVMRLLEEAGELRPTYAGDAGLRAKVEAVARGVYRAGRVDFLSRACTTINALEEAGFGGLPVCIAKTQYSFSDDPTLLGAPEGHVLTIRDARLSAGAGFVVMLAGEMQTMPGLPRRPAAVGMRVEGDTIVPGDGFVSPTDANHLPKGTVVQLPA